MTRFIAIASAKGGAGKTTAALNLAKAIADFGRDVVVVDANISKPNLAVHLGEHKLKKTIHSALKGEHHITECAYIHPSGFKVIPGGMSIDDLRQVDYERLKQALLDLEGTAQLIIIDTASGLGEETFAALSSADEVIVITEPELPSVADALKTIKKAEEKNCKIIGVVVNRAREGSEEMTIKSIEALLEKPVIAAIPEDKLVRRSISLKHPITYTHPDSKASIGFKEAAAKILGETYAHHLRKIEEESLFDFALKELGIKKQYAKNT